MTKSKRFSGLLHDAFYTFYDIINVSEVTFTVSVVEDLDSFSFEKFVCKSEVCHVWSAGWSIYGEEAETGRWNVVKFAVCVSHKFI